MQLTRRSRPPEARSAIKLLLVDDDDVDREKFCRMVYASGLLAKIEEASSGRDAIARVRAGRFDCIVVDYQLGDTNGTDLARNIKEESDYPVPVIMVTGQGDEGVAVTAMREGVYDYLTKSNLEPQSVATAIRGCLRRAEVEGELASSQEWLRRVSLFDELTCLPNRNLLFDRLEQTLQAAKRSESGFSLMMIDLNGFKEINDTFGHAGGDELLAEIGRRLLHLTRAADTFARIGGDEFAALLVGCDSASSARVVADKVHVAVNDPVAIEDATVTVSASIGVAIFPEHGKDCRTLLAHADKAMYRAKRCGRICEVYSAEGRETRDSLIAFHLPDALSRREIVLEYQPKVHLGTGAPASVEALARWRHPRLGLIPADDFMCVAERTSLIRPMSYAILEMALDQAARWRDDGLHLPVAVDLSARMVDDAELIIRTCQALRIRGLESDVLTYEVTEAALVRSDRAQENLQALRDAGIGIAIDDFCAGYTSLNCLRNLVVSEIKIDKAFISTLVSTSRDVAIVRSVAVLSREFNVTLVANGVESEGQRELLHGLGCDFGQGCALAPPMSGRQFEAWYARHEQASGTHAVRAKLPAESEDPSLRITRVEGTLVRAGRRASGGED